MIIDFTVSNFRSIRDEQTFSFHVEHPGSHLRSNIAYPAGNRIGVLKSLGTYGANASGKSNLLLAFKALRSIVRESGSLKDGDTIPWYDPFLLSEETRHAPASFEVELFTPDGTRYLYKIVFDEYRIIEEQLTFYPSGQPAVLFTRKESDTWKTISFGSLYKGGKKRLPFFANNTYLSKAGNSADTPESIRNFYNYFGANLLLIGQNETVILGGWTKDEALIEHLSMLLSAADTGIEGVAFEKRDVESPELPEELPETLKVALHRDMKWKPVFSHRTDKGSLEHFDLTNESGGTRRLFHLAPVILRVLASGQVILLDELESSMHPFMAELIIKLFNDPEVNPKGAQLIFTTHNVDIMSSELLRRDQIWFAEKEDGASSYFSLADFDKNIVKPRSPFSRWYLEGRFDAIPKIDYRRIQKMLSALRNSDAEEEK